MIPHVNHYCEFRCSLTRRCSTTCHGLYFENQTHVYSDRKCGFTGNADTEKPFCSQEETCTATLQCPVWNQGT